MATKYQFSYYEMIEPHAWCSALVIQESIYYLVTYTITLDTFRIRPSNNLIIYNGEQKTWHVISYTYLRS